MAPLAVLAIAPGAPAAAAPAQMLAIVQHGYGGPEVAKLERVPVPQPAADQVRIRVYAAGVNPSDYNVRTGPARPAGAAAASDPPPVEGVEVAGVIEAVGPGVTQFRVGEPVYSFLFGASEVPGNGGYAQYTLAKADSVAPKPRRFTFEQAAGTPSAGLAALRTVNDGHVQAGQSVVVIGAAGGVGSVIVQLAKGRGARVIAIAASQHNGYLKKLGADQIVNYDASPAALDSVRNADVVINTVPGQAAAALAYVKRGGAMISIAGDRPTEAQCAAAGATCPKEQRGRAPDRTSVAEQLLALDRLADAGQFHIYVEKTFPLAQTEAAVDFNHAGHAEGKVVVVLSPKASGR